METPPDKYRFVFREDGYRVTSFSYTGWIDGIRNHAQTNGYTLPEDWIAQAEHQLCQLLPPGWCKHEDGRPADQRVDARVGLDDVLHGTKVLISFVKNGAQIVPQELAESRAATCSGCYFLASAGGCGTCVGLSNLVEEVASNKSTRADAQLANKSCLVCKCVARAHIWLKAEDLAKGVTPEMMEQFSPFCWKRKELEALNA